MFIILECTLGLARLGVDPETYHIGEYADAATAMKKANKWYGDKGWKKGSAWKYCVRTKSWYRYRSCHWTVGFLVVIVAPKVPKYSWPSEAIS